MKVKCNPHHEIRLYIGSRRGYKGDEFTKAELIDFIHQCQAEAGPEEANPVRVTATDYVWAKLGETYQESGWEVAMINYPLRHKSLSILNRFALNLGESLLMHFRQNRISIVFPSEIVMLEADDPEEHL